MNHVLRSAVLDALPRLAPVIGRCQTGEQCLGWAGIKSAIWVQSGIRFSLFFLFCSFFPSRR